MNGGLHGTTSPFYSLERWKPNIRMGNRTVWVHCWGIPLQAWDRNRIRKIVGTMGDIVDVDDDVETKWRMDRARVLIRTPWTPAIKNVIEVHISGETFKVHVVEECGSMTCENHIKEWQGNGQLKHRGVCSKDPTFGKLPQQPRVSGWCLSRK